MTSLYFDEEHEIFRGQVRKFVENEVVPQADQWEEQGRIPRAAYLRMGELGFFGIPYPEKYGGTDGDIFLTVVLLEELCRSGIGGLTMNVGLQAYMATPHIFHAGSEDLKQRYLVPAIKGEKIASLGITEPNTGSDVASIQSRAVRDGDEYVINGAKTFITAGVYGDYVNLAVKTDTNKGVQGISLIIVEKGTPGFEVNRKLNKMGCRSSDTAELIFEDVRVPTGNLIGQENQGFYYIMETFEMERLVAAIISVGSSLVAVEHAVRYGQEREAFGKPIIKFQALRHRLADVITEVEAARQLVYHTCWLVKNGFKAVKECSMCKLFASEVAKNAIDECLQIFGGYGFMEEYPIARAYRDTRVGTIAGGTSEICREIISRIHFDQKVVKRAY